MIKNRSILFTGGGSSGHVVPNISLIRNMRERHSNIDILYIGSKNSIEEKLIRNIEYVKYFSINTEKLRRYFDMRNFLTPFFNIAGVLQSYMIMRKYEPLAVFSKGGFVGLPVVVASWMKGIPVIIHESDIIPGLANKLSSIFANNICVALKESSKYFPVQSYTRIKTLETYVPIRKELLNGDKNIGYEMCLFNRESGKKIILIQGGGLGSKAINEFIRNNLKTLIDKYYVVHICGHGKVDNRYMSENSYIQFEYIDKGIEHIFACADVIISRAGANSIYELVVMKKPHILIPLGNSHSRGEQIENARYFNELGTSVVLNQQNLNIRSFLAAIEQSFTLIEKNSDVFNKHRIDIISSTDRILSIIEKYMLSSI